MVRRGALIGIAAIGAAAAVVAVLVAVLIRWLPNSASEQMDRMEFVYWFATIICIAIFSVVIGVLGYILWKFRVKDDDETDGPPIHGNSKLEVVWTAVPAILVIAIGVVSAVVLSRNADAGPNPVQINVYAQQFAWYFTYPDAGDARSEELVMPVNRAVKFNLIAQDVIHSFWIPEMGQKQDLVPGVTNHIVVTPTRTGSFTLVCTELCGLGHALMRAPVRVLDKAAYESWLGELKGSSTDESSGGADGEALFASNGCGGCHAFAPAGSDGAIGPSLDNLAADAKKAGVPLEQYVKESITDPDAYLVPSYSAGVMPGTFAKTLKPAEIDALVQYLIGKDSTQ